MVTSESAAGSRLSATSSSAISNSVNAGLLKDSILKTTKKESEATVGPLLGFWLDFFIMHIYKNSIHIYTDQIQMVTSIRFAPHCVFIGFKNTL